MKSITLLGIAIALGAVDARGDERLQESIDKWKKAKNLPRKQKKQARKEALYDYRFFKALSDYMY